MKVFAIVVTYNGLQVPYWLDNCLGSLLSSVLPLHILVIDNASTDATVAYIRTHFPEVTLLQEARNTGFGQANNRGLRRALAEGADFVFLLNQDAWIEPQTLATLVRIAGEAPQYGLLAPLQLVPEKDHLRSDFLPRVLEAGPTSPWVFADDLYFGRLRDVYPVAWVNAAAWLIRRRVLETVGGFDPIFFHYGEDDNYLQRMAYHGLAVGLCPGARVVHDACERPPCPAAAAQSVQKNLLVGLADIRQAGAYRLFCRRQWKRRVKSLLRLRGRAWKESREALRFARRHQRAVRESRAQNMRVGRNWL